MAKAVYVTQIQKKRSYLKVLYSLIMIAIMILGSIIAREYVTINKIETLTQRIDLIENERLLLEEEIKLLEEEELSLQRENEFLEDTLWRYQPVVIPDSMK